MLDFCSACCVPIKFPLSFNMFPSSQCVPKYVLNISSLYPILFAMSSPLENLYIQPIGGGYNISILGTIQSLIFLDIPKRDANHFLLILNFF